MFEPLKGSYSGINCEVDIDLDKNHITANNVSAVLPPGRGKMECSVKIDILENDFKIYGKVNVQNGSLKWVYKWGTNLSLPYSSVTGTVSDLVVTKNYTEGRVKAVSTLDDGSVIDASGYCKVDYTTTTNVSMVLANIKGTVNNSAINLKKFYLNFDTGQLYFTAGPVDANISDIRKIVSQIPRDLNGRISGNLSLSKGSYDGILTLTDVSYGQDKMIKSINAVIQINNNVFSSEKINLELFDQPAVVSIASTNSSLNDFVLTILVKDFNVPAKHSKGTQLSMNSTGQSNTNGIKVRGNIIIENLKSGEYYLKNTEINYGFEKNVLTVNKLKTSFLDTVIDGKGSVDLQKKFPEINVDLNFNNFKVQALSIYLKNIENRFYGSASGKANLFMRLDSEPVKSVKGTLEVKIDNGKLVNTGIQNGLGIILEPLKYKLQDLEFSTIYSNINIEEKGYKINSFVFDAPDIQLSMNGFLESDFGGDLNILLHFNKNFIKDIPNFTFPQLNKYKENNTYSIKINAKGADVTNSNYIKVIDE